MIQFGVIEAKYLNHDNNGDGDIVNGCNSNSGSGSDDDGGDIGSDV